MEFSIPLSGKNEPLFTDALFLRDKVTLDPKQKFRLVGVGLGNFHYSGEDTEPSLFA
jgi:hypothetical protein